MGTIETGKIISTIRKQKNINKKDIATLLNVSDEDVSKWEKGECYPDVALLPQLASILGISIDQLLAGRNTSGENCVAAESKFSRQYTMEEYNYLKGTIISFAVIAVTLYLSLTRFYMMQLVSMMLIFISLCIFCLYDIKYSNLLNQHQYLEMPLNFSGMQASCRQFILTAGITASIFVNLISVPMILIQNKYFDLEIQFYYTLMAVIFYTFVNLFIFLKSKKNNAKVSPYFHVGIVITILSSLVIICYQIYIKVGMKYTLNNEELLVLQNRIDRLFILLMAICIIYSLLIFTLHNMSNKYKGILFALSVLQHSLLLFVARYSVWFNEDVATNLCGGIYIGYIGVALTISMTLYYLQTCISRRTAQ